MGATLVVQLCHSDSMQAQEAASAAFRLVDSLEASMSDYRIDSELLSIGTEWRPVSPHLYDVLLISKALSRQSRGAFDPTIGPLSRLWRRAFRRNTWPSAAIVAMSFSLVNYRKFRMSNGCVRFSRRGMRLDLGGIAKGYALDVVGRELRQRGMVAFLLDLGGDLLLGEAPPNKPGWCVAGVGGWRSCQEHNIAIATSGDTYRYLDHDGVRYSHIIDPRTGYGVTHRRLVTVRGPRAAVADGLASTLSVGWDDWATYYGSKYTVMMTTE